ncbi:TonB-dependent receptor [Psychrobium sp. 1_MG-2023]|uniref:TonB-dependent receptor n=1 Tax=Psychrobium sp. 1_MG-2023 TaxID=3062624 RepID=UPI000C32D860|nr:TonB-dependent receptor [Psychrobium sp. 1_MG-2023]MDP2561960.1 TonB-dependent receptor [Psychrobium sp. 1_MG-2023]PKF58658.1 TonB-dependent receptor [Alteromonadales bacterium alter-6D02]
MMNKLKLLAVLTMPLAISTYANETNINQKEVERIDVTGSRISRADMETASPVSIIDANAIKAGGFTSVDQILGQTSAAAGMSLGATTNNGSGGSATVNLRGMGSQRTLVLLDGKRMVNSGTGADSTVDLNTIPVAMIARIEILKDGASAVYGSDAIAGVVNIITKKDFDGVEVDISGNQSSKGDGQSADMSILVGRNFEKGNATFGLSYTDRGEVMQGDRDYIPAGESSFIPEGTLGGRVPDGNGGFKERDTSYDYAAESYAQTPSERLSIFAKGSYEFEQFELNTDVLFTNRKSNQQMAPQPASVDLDTDKLNIPGGTPDVGIPGLDLDSIEYKRRMTDAGNRIYEQDTDTLRASISAIGEFDILNGVNWELSYVHGSNEASDVTYNSINATKMEQSIYDHQDQWFSGNPLSQDIVDDISYTDVASGGNKQDLASFLVSGDAWEMPNGDVAAFAAGVEYRRDEGWYTPDQVVQDGDSTAAQQDATKGSYKTGSAYVELSVPVTDKLTSEFAVRYDKYSTFGSATTWKVGNTYTATDELKLRGVLATGYRAPSVAELFGGDSGSFDYLTDPWGNEEDSQIKVIYTSDPNLQPEQSKSLTLGAVYEPASLDGFSTTVDYWQFKITDAISRVNVQTSLNDCYAGDTDACEIINVTPEGNLDEMQATLTNVGYQETSGVDWNMQYGFTSGAIDWKLNLDTTFLLNFEEDGVDYTGTIDGNNGAYSELKSNLTVGAQLDALSLNYSARFLSGMDGDYYGTPFDTASVVYHNVSGAYQFNDAVTFSAGINNLFDKEPEEVPNGNDAGTVPAVYDVVGRTIFAGVNVRF